MEIFNLTLNQMIYFFIMIVIGYLLKKFKVFDDIFDSIISRLLSFVVTPTLIIESFYQRFKVDIIRDKFYYLITGLILTALLYIFAYYISKLFTKDKYIRNIYTYSFTNANFGYMGYVLVEALFGSEALFNMIIFTIPFNLYAFTIGINSLNPNNSKITIKSMINPITISLLLGAILGLSGITLPEVGVKTLSNISSTMGPLAMITTGFIIAKYNILDIIKDYRVYIASILRLIIIPSIVVIIMKMLNIDDGICMIALCTTAMPCGLNGIIFPAAYGGDTRTGAGMALISDILAVITIPLLFFIFM